MENLPIFELVISEDEAAETEVNFIALVKKPAIERNFIAFAQEDFVEPGAKETEDEFIGRCIPYMIAEGYEQEQAAAVCYSKWGKREKFAGLKVSFDYDDTLSTDRGKELAMNRIDDGDTVYIISARNDKNGMMSVAQDLSIPESRIYATGSNSAKIAKIKELGIDKHYDNNPDVISAIGDIGIKFSEIKFDAITDIPDDVRANARNAVEWAEKNGWGSCGTPVGKRRASQLADRGGAVSLDTVRRMYSYLSRHAGDLDNSKGYGDGCGKLMYDAWGGKSGLSWARNVLRRENMHAFAIQDEDERIVSGPLMVPGKKIYRRDGDNEYFVTFSADTIKAIAMKFMRKRYQGNVNIMHDGEQVVPGAVLFETWIKDTKRGVGGMAGYDDLPDGTWFGSIKIEDDATWADVKAGKLQGFSVEGVFGYVRERKTEIAAETMMAEIVAILQSVGQ